MTFEDLSNEEKISISELVQKIAAYKVIPVIGYDLYAEFANQVVSDDGIVKTGQNVDISEVVRIDNTQIESNDFYRLIAEHLIQTPENFKRQDNGTRAFGMQDLEGCHGMDYFNVCYSAFKTVESYTAFGEEVSDAWNELFPNVPITSAFTKLAKIGNFKFYIDTTIFRRLEAAVKSYRLDRNDQGMGLTILRPIDFNNPENDRLQGINNEKDIDNNQPLVNLNKAVIWNFFGYYNDRPHTANITDVHMQEVLYNYIRNEDRSVKKVREIFKDVGFLFIGCTFKDWIFRFILRFLTGKRLDQRVEIDLADDILHNNTDPSRTVFITKYGIRNFNINSCEFINILYSQLVLNRRIEITNGQSCHAFISFAKEDRAYALSIYHILKTQYAVDCFLDEMDMHGADKLGSTIEKSINNCAVFIPVVSNNFNAAKGRDSYVIAEWHWAISNYNQHDFKIMPLFVPSYKYTNLTEVPRELSGILNPGGFLGGVLKAISDETFIERAIQPGMKIDEAIRYVNALPKDFIPPFFIHELIRHQQNCSNDGSNR